MRHTLFIFALVLGLGCNGIIFDPGVSPGEGEPWADPGITDPGFDGPPTPRWSFPGTDPAPETGIRMVTNVELAQSIYDFTGIRPDVSALPEELDVLNLDNDASRSTVRDAAHMQVLLEIATDVAVRAEIDTILSCAADECTDLELRNFLVRAFIREVDDEVFAPYRAAFDEKLADEGGVFARRTMLQMALISPLFVYRTEIGAGGALTGPELASKLSFFLWGTRPDDRLLEASFDGSLSSDVGYASEVDRLLDSPRARERITWLIHLWLGTDRFDHQTKTNAAELDEQLTSLLYEEVRLLIEDVLFESGGTLEDLFLAEHTFVNDALAAHYGWEAVGSDEFVRVELAGTDRRGILTTGLVLAAHSKENGRSPIQRGAFLLQEMMCHSFAPTAGVALMELPEAGPDATFRDRFTPLENVAPCSNCHQTLNAGFAFEIFDEVGRLQPEGVVLPEEVSGFFDLPPYERLEFTSTIEAVEGFARHPATSSCFVTQSYRYAQGRMPGSQDTEAIEGLEAGFDGDVMNLFREIALSDAFSRGVSR